MGYLKMERKIIIFGGGIQGEKFLCLYGAKLKVECIFDNLKEGSFHGIKIKKPSFLADVFIIVASGHYLEIRDQLRSLNYSEFQDFIPAEIYNKKMVVAYGNCHMGAVRRYLEQSVEFTREYGFYPFPSVQMMKEQFDYKDILSHCDLFMHQSIREENGFGWRCSSNAFLQYVSKTCTIVAVPNLYGLPKCFFPQISRRESQDCFMCSFFPYEEVNVSKWIREGKSKEEIKKKMIMGGVYSSEYIIDLWNEFKKTLLEREKEWDIKISDYILENYKKEKLFYELFHISSKLAREIAIRILQYLGYPVIDMYLIPCLDEYEVFIYKDVKEALNLEFEERTIRKHRKEASLRLCEMNIDEFVDQMYRYLVCSKSEMEYYIDDEREKKENQHNCSGIQC